MLPATIQASHPLLAVFLSERGHVAGEVSIGEGMARGGEGDGRTNARKYDFVLG